MPAAPIPANEADRLTALRRLEILDTAPDERFDRITWMARVYFQAPVALISLVDADRQWFKSCYGFGDRQTERTVSFCGHVVAAGEPIVVSDARLDPRFFDSRLVTGQPYIRFYAAVPLHSPDNHVVGTLCIIDNEPRPAESFDLAMLREFGDSVERELAASGRRAGAGAAAGGYDSAAGAGDGLAVIDFAGLVLSVNPVAELVLGRGQAEIVGTHVRDLISDESLADIERAVAEAGEAANVSDTETCCSQSGWAVTREAVIRRKDGGSCPVDLTVTPFRRQHRPVYLASFRDVTDRKRAERANLDALAAHRMANVELDRLNQLKSEFIAMVSHEFRTALTGIQAFSELIRDGDLSSEEVRDFANDINTDALRLTRMITDMLSLEKLESGQMPLRLERLDLDETVADLVNRSRHSAPGHQFEFLPGGVPAIAADRDKLVQALTNLLTNAVKYSPDGGKIVISTSATGDEVRICVMDQGPGLEPSELERIFDRYHRSENASARAVSGTGLGLPIVRQIARLHGGHAWAENRLEGGSAFHLRISARVQEPVLS